MHTHKRWALLGLFAAALLMATTPVVTAPTVWAEDEAEEGAEPKTIQWVKSWDEGAKIAAETNKLVFVYFGRHSPR